MYSNNNVAFGFIVFVIGFVLYFLPSFFALKRKCRSRGAIVFINLILGWTLIGWLAAFIWANVSPREIENFSPRSIGKST
jgi:apolipoprotein N-acyltransferase